MNRRDEIVDDAAMMTALHLWSQLRSIATLPPEAGLKALATFVRAAILAYRREVEGEQQPRRPLPRPSRN